MRGYEGIWWDMADMEPMERAARGSHIAPRVPARSIGSISPHIPHIPPDPLILYSYVAGNGFLIDGGQRILNRWIGPARSFIKIRPVHPRAKLAWITFEHRKYKTLMAG